MVTNNSLNQASEIFIIGPIGTTADGTTILTIRKDQAANTQAKIQNNTNSGQVFWSLEQKMSSSATRSSAGFGILPDNWASPAIASFAVLQSDITGLTEPGLGVCIYGAQSGDIVKVAIGATAVTQATWNSTGGQYRGFNGNTVAPAGYIGEVIKTVVLRATGLAVTTTATAQTIASITLTPGNWIISGTIGAVWQGGTITNQFGAISPTTNSLTNVSGEVSVYSNSALPTAAINDSLIYSCSGISVSINTNTTYYLVASMTFGVGGNPTVYGRISAVRVG